VSIRPILFCSLLSIMQRSLMRGVSVVGVASILPRSTAAAACVRARSVLSLSVSVSAFHSSPSLAAIETGAPTATNAALSERERLAVNDPSLSTRSPQERATLVAQQEDSASAAAASTPVGLTGGAPESFIRRKCRIYRPSRSATQQGAENRWKIEFDTPNKWINPLMGWTSSRDTAEQLREMLMFDSKDAAIAFAEREGFEYEVQDYHWKIIRPKSFADNFRWKGPPKTQRQ